MKLYVTLEQSVAERLAVALETEYTNNLASAEAFLVFFKNPAGGISEPSEISRYIVVPTMTIVIAGPFSPGGEAFAEAACEAGVPPENILFTGAKGIRVSDISPYLKKLKNTASNNSVPFISFGGETQKKSTSKARPIVKVPKVIGVLSAKGGVGKTTIAASLVAHYTSVDEKAVLYDLGSPRCGRYHLTSKEQGDVLEKGIEEFEEFKPAYRRIVVDTSPLINGLDFEKVVVVVDADVIQTVEPTRSILSQKGIVPDVIVYNRKKAEVPEDIIKAYFENTPLIVIEDDFAGCVAALAAGLPASVKSQKIAQAVGQIAAVIDKEV